MLKREFIRFVLVGGSSTLLMFGLLALFVDGLGLPATPASALAYLLSGTLNYWLNYHWTFASQQEHGRAARRFIAVATVGLSLNSAIMFLLVEQHGVYYLLAQVVATVTVLLWNYLANRTWTFQPQNSSRP